VSFSKLDQAINIPIVSFSALPQAVSAAELPLNGSSVAFFQALSASAQEATRLVAAELPNEANSGLLEDKPLSKTKSDLAQRPLQAPVSLWLIVAAMMTAPPQVPVEDDVQGSTAGMRTPDQIDTVGAVKATEVAATSHISVDMAQNRRVARSDDLSRYNAGRATEVATTSDRPAQGTQPMRTETEPSQLRGETPVAQSQFHDDKARPAETTQNPLSHMQSKQGRSPNHPVTVGPTGAGRGNATQAQLPGSDHARTSALHMDGTTKDNPELVQSVSRAASTDSPSGQLRAAAGEPQEVEGQRDGGVGELRNRTAEAQRSGGAEVTRPVADLTQPTDEVSVLSSADATDALPDTSQATERPATAATRTATADHRTRSAVAPTPSARTQVAPAGQTTEQLFILPWAVPQRMKMPSAEAAPSVAYPAYGERDSAASPKRSGGSTPPGLPGVAARPASGTLEAELLPDSSAFAGTRLTSSDLRPMAGRSHPVAGASRLPEVQLDVASAQPVSSPDAGRPQVQPHLEVVQNQPYHDEARPAEMTQELSSRMQRGQDQSSVAAVLADVGREGNVKPTQQPEAVRSQPHHDRVRPAEMAQRPSSPVQRRQDQSLDRPLATTLSGVGRGNVRQPQPSSTDDARASTMRLEGTTRDTPELVQSASGRTGNTNSRSEQSGAVVEEPRGARGQRGGTAEVRQSAASPAQPADELGVPPSADGANVPFNATRATKGPTMEAARTAAAERDGTHPTVAAAPSARAQTVAGEQAAEESAWFSDGKPKAGVVQARGRTDSDGLSHYGGGEATEVATTSHASAHIQPNSWPHIEDAKPPDQAAEAPLPRPAARELLEQVATRTRDALAKGQMRWHMQLRPPALGRIDVRMTLDDKSLTLHIRADRPEVKTLIETHLDQLRDALREQGIHLADCLVSTGQGSVFPGMGWGGTSQQWGTLSQPGRLHRSPKPQRAEQASLGVPLVVEGQQGTRIDYRV